MEGGEGCAIGSSGRRARARLWRPATKESAMNDSIVGNTPRSLFGVARPRMCLGGCRRPA